MIPRSGKPVDVLIVNPPSPDGTVYMREICRCGRQSREGMIWPQTSLAFIAGAVDERFSVDIVDCIGENIDWPRFEEILRQKRPRYLVTYLISSIIYNDLRAARLAGELGATTIAIGPHVTTMPESIADFPEVDYAIRGEVEETIVELLDHLEEGSEPAGVKGIAYCRGGSVTVTGDRPLLEDLGKLPRPRQDLLPLDHYRMPMIDGPFTMVTTSRGCPYPCIFCRKMALWGNRVRLRPVDDIFAELLWLNELGVDNVVFLADLFTVNRKQVIDLCKRIVEARLPLKWQCNSRVDHIDEELLAWMKRAGCWQIAFGLESGSQEVLDRARKEIAIEQAKTAIDLVDRFGIKSWGYFIIGLPGETKETIRATIDLAKRLPLNLALFHVAVPYPGTEFSDLAREHGWLLSDRWEDLDMNYSAIVEYPQLPAKEIDRWAKRAFLEWYLRPAPALRLLGSVRDARTLKAVGRNIVRHLRWLGS
ncbi:MAG: radical SAM protein [Thermoleophilia bacterium]|nr:radical SAM protein [Thermoleophilia bacterium]